MDYFKFYDRKISHNLTTSRLYNDACFAQEYPHPAGGYPNPGYGTGHPAYPPPQPYPEPSGYPAQEYPGEAIVHTLPAVGVALAVQL